MMLPIAEEVALSACPPPVPLLSSQNTQVSHPSTPVGVPAALPTHDGQRSGQRSHVKPEQKDMSEVRCGLPGRFEVQIDGSLAMPSRRLGAPEPAAALHRANCAGSVCARTATARGKDSVRRPELSGCLGRYPQALRQAVSGPGGPPPSAHHQPQARAARQPADSDRTVDPRMVFPAADRRSGEASQPASRAGAGLVAMPPLSH